MINDQKVNTYFQRTIDFLDLLNLIFYIIKHHVTGCVRQVSTRHPSPLSLSPTHNTLHLSCSAHKVTNDRPHLNNGMHYQHQPGHLAIG